MLPCNPGGHSAYQKHVLEQLRKYYPVTEDGLLYTKMTSPSMMMVSPYAGKVMSCAGMAQNLRKQGLNLNVPESALPAERRPIPVKILVQLLNIREPSVDNIYFSMFSQPLSFGRQTQASESLLVHNCYNNSISLNSFMLHDRRIISYILFHQIPYKQTWP